MIDLLCGQVDAGFLIAGGVRPQLESGKLIALAVSGKQRRWERPDIPTLSESGYPGFSITFADLVMVPAGVPEPVKRY